MAAFEEAKFKTADFGWLKLGGAIELERSSILEQATRQLWYPSSQVPYKKCSVVNVHNSTFTLSKRLGKYRILVIGQHGSSQSTGAKPLKLITELH